MKNEEIYTMESKKIIEHFGGDRENAVAKLCELGVCKRAYAYRVLSEDIVPINIGLRLENLTKGELKVETSKYYKR